MLTNKRATHNNACKDLRVFNVAVGSHVWLLLSRVKAGYACKLAHLWHGPFIVAEHVHDYMLCLELQGTDYSFFPLVHASRVKAAQLTLHGRAARLPSKCLLLAVDS